MCIGTGDGRETEPICSLFRDFGVRVCRDSARGMGLAGNPVHDPGNGIGAMATPA